MGGWLLLFCINLTLIGPVNFVRTAMRWHDAAARVSTHMHVLVVNTIALHYLGLAILCFVTGLWLWTLGSGALTLARCFLICYSALSLLILVAHLFFGFVIRDWTVFDLGVRPLVFSGIWFSYLVVSKRVKATYCCTE